MAVNITDLPPGQIRNAPAMPWRPPQRLLGFLAPGVVIPANDTNGVVVACAGSGRIRVVAKVSAGGTLRLRWRIADHLTSVTPTASNPADPGTALVAATELVIDVAANPGHAYLEVAVVNGGAPSTVSYVDIFQTPYSN
jgi:hypothetical protein